jgi:hypothetical protein
MMMITVAVKAGIQQVAFNPSDSSGSTRNGSSRTSEGNETASPDSLLLTIKRLEERVKELENRIANTGKPGLPASSTTLASAAPAALPAVSFKQDQKPDLEKKNGLPGFFHSTEISGFVDAYFGYNFNRPAADAQLRNFDTKHNQFAFNLAELALEKKVTPDDRLGFRMDLNVGPATEMVHAAEPGGGEVFKHIQQGYISYLAPAGKGLQLDIGKFVTQHGAEVIETRDNWNYSRSLLFALAIPYYHFGLRATYPVSDKASLSGFVVNGWNNVVDNNRRKTFGVQAVIKPTPSLTISQNYMFGPEQAGNNDDWRHLWDGTVTYAVNDSVSLLANYDYGFDRLNGARVHWQGIAAYARIQPSSKKFAFSPRFEWYSDHDGFTTGVRQSVKEFTLTGEHTVRGGLLARLEYRRDFSDREFFLRSTGHAIKSQSTVSVGFVYAFSSTGER